ncbi:hypothetical protein AB2N08_04775 [Massilia aurea]|uniref:hypothetical protein n=1 Tax=Massilia aurea TaxID=373040 RepID=UPI003463635E
MASSSPRTGNVSHVLFIVIVALAGLLLPAVFGQTVTVSPLVLFAVAVVPNFIAYLIPAQGGDDNGMFSRVFFFRLGHRVLVR